VVVPVAASLEWVVIAGGVLRQLDLPSQVELDCASATLELVVLAGGVLRQLDLALPVKLDVAAATVELEVSAGSSQHWYYRCRKWIYQYKWSWMP
jgi:hypothetical protein